MARDYAIRTERWARRVKRRQRRNYYGSRGLSRAERLEPGRAGSVEGPADEIALLRAQLKKVARRCKRGSKARKDLRAASRWVKTLVKAVATEHRLSLRGKGDVGDNMARVLESLGDLILPGDR